MPTIDQLREYLASIGVNPPDFMLQAWLDAVADMQACFTANGVPASLANLITLYTLGLYGIATGDRYISSQTAPSGASQSFRYKSLEERWKAQLSLLNQFDKYGCSGPFLPADPTGTQIAAMVGRPPRRGDCC